MTNVTSELCGGRSTQNLSPSTKFQRRHLTPPKSVTGLRRCSISMTTHLDQTQQKETPETQNNSGPVRQHRSHRHNLQTLQCRRNKERSPPKKASRRTAPSRTKLRMKMITRTPIMPE